MQDPALPAEKSVIDRQVILVSVIRMHAETLQLLPGERIHPLLMAAYQELMAQLERRIKHEEWQAVCERIWQDMQTAHAIETQSAS